MSFRTFPVEKPKPFGLPLGDPSVERSVSGLTSVQAPKILHSFVVTDGQFQEPHEIDSKHLFKTAEFSCPAIGSSLTQGFEKWKAFDSGKDSKNAPATGSVTRPAPLVNALNAVSASGNPNLQETLQKAKFVSYRNNFNKIMKTPYDCKHGWEMEVTRRNGQVFLDICQQQDNGAGSSAEDMYTGRCFEALCTGQEPPGDMRSEICVASSTSVAEHSVLLFAEVDCHSTKGNASDSEQPLRHFVELKCMVSPETPNQVAAFSLKLLRAWVQSYLVGVPEVVVGFKHKSRKLKSVVSFDTLSIPDVAANLSDVKDPWSAQACIDFTANFLKWILENVSDGQRRRLRFIPAKGKSSGDCVGTIEMIPSMDEHSFISAWSELH